MNQRTHHALLGLVAAAAVGGLTTAVGIVLAMVIPAFTNGFPPPVEILTETMMAVAMILMLSIYTAIVFAMGLLIVGLPAWAVLYRLGFRTRWVAVLAGSVLTSATASALAFALNASHSDAGWFGLLMIPPGAAAGWTLHRVAYGRSKPA
jgi:hypothetical protein